MSNLSSDSNLEVYWDPIRKMEILSSEPRKKKSAWTKLDTLIGANLQGQDLKGINLEKADLRKAHLEEADLSHANLINTKLTDAYLKGAKLIQARLQYADLRGADLREADLIGANLTGAKLQNQNLENFSLIDIILEKAHLEDVNLKNADLIRVNLLEAHLEKSDLSDANLIDSFLIKANLTGANLRGANLTGSDLREADLTGVNLENTNLTGADLTGAHFSLFSLDDKQREQIKVSIIENLKKKKKKFGPVKYSETEKLTEYLDKPYNIQSANILLKQLSVYFPNSTSSNSQQSIPFSTAPSSLVKYDFQQSVPVKSTPRKSGSFLTPTLKNFSRQFVPTFEFPARPSFLANSRINTSNKINISPNFLSNNRDLYNLIMDIDLPENFKFQLEGEKSSTSRDLTKIIFDKLLSFYTDKYFIKNKDKSEFILLRQDINFDELYNNTLQLIKIAKAAQSDIKLNINPEIIQLLLLKDPKKNIGNRKNFNTLFANVKSKLKNKSVKNMSESFMNNLLEFIIKDTKNLDQLAKTFKIELAFRRILNEYGFTSWEQYIDMAEFIKIFSDSFTHL